MGSGNPGESGQHRIELGELRLPEVTDWDGENTEITGVRTITATQVGVAGDTEEGFAAADVFGLDFDDIKDTDPEFNLASEMFDED